MENENRASRLRMTRISKGMTLVETAQKIGVTAATVARWENGGNYPDIDKALELSRLYDVPIKDLFAELFMLSNTKSN